MKLYELHLSEKRPLDFQSKSCFYLKCVWKMMKMSFNLEDKVMFREETGEDFA